MLAPHWSFKKWKMYKQCPMAVKLKYVERCPEPPPDPKSEEARQRGIRVHDQMRAAVLQETEVPAFAKDFSDIIAALVERGAQAEVPMYLNNRWLQHPTYEGHWLQLTQDVLVVAEQDGFVLTGDWKTGRRYGNEYFHFKQMELYSVAAWRVYPGMPEYINELYYLDKKDVWTITFTEAQLEKALANWDAEVDVMFNDKTFRPRPSVDNCRFCPFSSRGSGACPVAAC